MALEKIIEKVKPDLEEIKKAKYPVGKLLDFYVYLKGNGVRKYYLEDKSKTVKKEKLNAETIRAWILGRTPFPLRYLNAFVKELKVPIEEIIEVNNNKNPFEPDLKKIKKAKNSRGALIEFYIALKYKTTLNDYLKNKSRIVKKENLNAGTTLNWLNQWDYDFPLKYFKKFVDELKIPLEKVIELNNGKDPFKPDLEKFKKTNRASGKLIEHYIHLRHGSSRVDYLRNKSMLVKKMGWSEHWFKGSALFPLKYLKNIIKELKIPIEEVIEANNGKNPFKPDLEEFKKAKCPTAKLIDFYINLKYGLSHGEKHGFSRNYYLRNKCGLVKKEKLSASAIGTEICKKGRISLNHLKSFADELQIPYKEINYLIDGDIEKGIARAGNVKIEPGTELIFDSVKYYIQQYQKGQKERPSVFYPKPHPEFKKQYGISTRQIYRSLYK